MTAVVHRLVRFPHAIDAISGRMAMTNAVTANKRPRPDSATVNSSKASGATANPQRKDKI